MRQLSTRVLHVACAAQQFLLDVLPIDDEKSPHALSAFCDALTRHRVGRVTTEGAIVGVLRKLEIAIGVSDQMLVGQYFSLEASTPDPCARLKFCVERLISTHATTHPCVAAALRMINDYYQDRRLRLDIVAKRLRVSPSYLSHLISSNTGKRFRSHVRGVRMRAAATRFADGSATIQEVAAAVGYTHLADFDHHFKAFFGLTPSGYRAQLSMSGVTSLPASSTRGRSTLPGPAPAVPEMAPGSDASGKAQVLIVEDGRSTSDAFGRVLRHAGYEVAVATDTSTGRRLFQEHAPPVTLARSVGNPTGLLPFVHTLRALCNRRQAMALVTVDVVLPPEQEQQFVDLGVTIVFEPLLPREIVGLISRLLVVTPA